MAAAPGLLRVTLAIVSPLTRPLLPSGVLLVNSVPAKVTAWPYVLLVLAAVIVKSRLFTVSAPLT